MIERDLKDITEADLQKLIDDPVREGKTIEYKMELALKDDAQKRKFFRSIASFANASGGDMIFGMRAEDGKPCAIVPLPDFNPDSDILRLRDLIRAHIDPKVFTVDFHPVALTIGGFALVIRIRKTWAGAHMVTYNNDFRFYTRDLAGCRLMDVPEVRSAFALAEATTEKINRFRLERLGNIISGETPRPLQGTATIVIHLCPLRSFEPSYQCNLSALHGASNNLQPLNASGWTPSYDLDGFFTYDRGFEENAFGYCLVFRNGCIEVTDTSLLRQRDGGTFFPSVAYEQRILEGIPRWFKALAQVGAEPPVVVMLSLLGVKGYWMYVGPQFRGGIGDRPISREQVIIPASLVETLDIESNSRETPNNVVDLMRPMFDSVWNACGHPYSMNFDQNGNWKPSR